MKPSNKIAPLDPKRHPPVANELGIIKLKDCNISENKKAGVLLNNCIVNF